MITYYNGYLTVVDKKDSAYCHFLSSHCRNYLHQTNFKTERKLKIYNSKDGCVGNSLKHIAICTLMP